MRIFKTPEILIRLLPRITWRGAATGSQAEKLVYLSFDDGPVPEATPFVLTQLEKYRAKATFFCVGDNAARYPHLVKAIKKAGHALGNHTHNHLNGWKTPTASYLMNIDKCRRVIPSRLFRPPYGKISPAQYRQLSRTYKIVLWDIVSYDFDAALSPEDCLAAVKARVRPGSIIVFHDSIKAMKNLQTVLPLLLEYLKQEGYSFRKIAGE